MFYISFTLLTRLLAVLFTHGSVINVLQKFCTNLKGLNGFVTYGKMATFLVDLTCYILHSNINLLLRFTC